MCCDASRSQLKLASVEAKLGSMTLELRWLAREADEAVELDPRLRRDATERREARRAPLGAALQSELAAAAAHPASESGGGQWTDGGRVAQTGGAADAEVWPTKPASELPVLRVSDPEGDPPEQPPEIPPNKPPTARQQNTVVKQIARWLLMMALNGSPIIRYIETIQTGLWILDHRARIEAYQDEPRDLEELQRAVAERRSGYDIHHIVEQTPAEDDGFPRSRIDAPENLVRIPTLKHWEINGWFSTPNEDYGGLSPREYLRGKGWNERTKVGLFALRKYGVLKP